MLRHSSATYWAAKLNRYQLCAKYGWAFSSDMPDRYIERKGIIFDQIAEKGDVDQTTRLQKENRNLVEKMETLEREYNKQPESRPRIQLCSSHFPPLLFEPFRSSLL